jgi:hypothetical protein
MARVVPPEVIHYGADVNRPDLYALSLGIPVAPVPPYDPRNTIKRMLETAADLQTRATAFGHLRKDIIPNVKRPGMPTGTPHGSSGPAAPRGTREHQQVSPACP